MPSIQSIHSIEEDSLTPVSDGPLAWPSPNEKENTHFECEESKIHGVTVEWTDHTLTD